MRPIHVTLGNLLYSKSTNLNVNLIQKTLSTEISRIMFDQMSGHSQVDTLSTLWQLGRNFVNRMDNSISGYVSIPVGTGMVGEI